MGFRSGTRERLKSMTERDRRFRDWELVYVDEVIDKVKHWGDGRKVMASFFQPSKSDLDESLFEPGR